MLYAEVKIWSSLAGMPIPRKRRLCLARDSVELFVTKMTLLPEPMSAKR